MKKLWIIIGCVILIICLLLIQRQTNYNFVDENQMREIDYVATSGVKQEEIGSLSGWVTGQERYEVIIDHLTECDVESIVLPFSIDDREYGVLEHDDYALYGREIGYLKYIHYGKNIDESSIRIHCEPKTWISKNSQTLTIWNEYIVSGAVETTVGGEIRLMNEYVGPLGYSQNNTLNKVYVYETDNRYLIILGQIIKFPADQYIYAATLGLHDNVNEQKVRDSIPIIVSSITFNNN